jgi:hypothetical protein
MLIRSATADVISARRRHQHELAERNGLGAVVVSIDEVILACEETHLLSIKKCPAVLKEQRKRVLVQARRAVSRSSRPDAVGIVEEQMAREVRKVIDVMDSLWIVQEVIFDLMQLWRSDGQDIHRDNLGPHAPRAGAERHAA